MTTTMMMHDMKFSIGILCIVNISVSSCKLLPLLLTQHRRIRFVVRLYNVHGVLYRDPQVFHLSSVSMISVDNKQMLR